MILFQSTRPRGARHIRHLCHIVNSKFQSTRPRGARLINDRLGNTYFEFQSTRPRGARPINGVVYGVAPEVSIHAPAGGATQCGRMLSRQRVRFNPRARGGRDDTVIDTAVALVSFNPRARGGRDMASAS